MHKFKSILLFSLLCVISGGSWAYSLIPSKLAEPAVKASLVAFPNSQEERVEFINAFCEAFLNRWRYGFDNKNLTTNIIYSPPSANAGHQKGLEESKNRTKYWVTPHDFGYSIQELTGNTNTGFELSEFVVNESERYHLNWRDLKDIPKYTVTVQAWVSPEGMFGHFGGWTREIIIIKIIE